jgi:hypothetical protein
MDNPSQSALFSLSHKYVGVIRGTFVVQDYQRGYRWGADEVQHLLDDIWNSEGRDYSLQPVVVKLDKENVGEQGHDWELIDGQQRLTTLYLIFHYMQKQGWRKTGAPYSIDYKTRPGSAAYLKTLDPAIYKTNIDYFHMYKAYERIGQWFQSLGDDEFGLEDKASRFSGYLFRSVRVIWYEAPARTIATELYTRLNVGRIPLTDAELVKAQLISGLRETQTDVAQESSVRTQEVAAQWDGIERDLRDPDVWHFLVWENDYDEEYPTRISLLLDTEADTRKPFKSTGKRPRHHTFETLRGEIKTRPLEFWNAVLESHALILGWFANHSLYNKIGFLVATGTSFGTLVQLAQGQKKSDFEKFLIGRIRGAIDVGESKLSNLSYDKPSDRSKLLNILLLMNVEAVSRTGRRFPFRRHVGETWSLEHIHAQNAESLNKLAQWKAWLEAHQKALRVIAGQQALVQEIEMSLQQADTSSDFGPTFQRLAARVMEVFSAPTGDASVLDHRPHSISNLALLSRSDNSALNNAVFEVKRRIVLEIDRNIDGKQDGYIPVCTRNVFLKYYADPDETQIHLWSPQDRVGYLKAIASTLKEYLAPETMAKDLAQ